MSFVKNTAPSSIEEQIEEIRSAIKSSSRFRACAAEYEGVDKDDLEHTILNVDVIINDPAVTKYIGRKLITTKLAECFPGIKLDEYFSDKPFENSKTILKKRLGVKDTGATRFLTKDEIKDSAKTDTMKSFNYNPRYLEALDKLSDLIIHITDEMTQQLTVRK